jgi:hypothetical protein
MEAKMEITEALKSLMEKLRQGDAGKNATGRIQSMQTCQELTEFRFLAGIPFKQISFTFGILRHTFLLQALGKCRITGGCCLPPIQLLF